MNEVAIVRPTTVADLKALVGRELGPTDWFEITQQDINAFADVTRDHQWIHVDPERAADSVFGTTIAHGLFSLSLGPWFMEQLMAFDGFAHSLNYGYDKVRLMSTNPVGSRIRMRATIESVETVTEGTAHLIIKQTIEREGQDKPICVAVSVARMTEHSA